MTELAKQARDVVMIMIDANHLEAHRTAWSLAVKTGCGRLTRRIQGGLNLDLACWPRRRAVRSICFFRRATSDCVGA